MPHEPPLLQRQSDVNTVGLIEVLAIAYNSRLPPEFYQILKCWHQWVYNQD
ncbi:hypothetical protein PN466_01705 [Roseofilum reptotaenium CS-1145]|uniref:hypothetical protein n=1 Tax=Roseofilum reptotaenium TaxID=1233427 RepID=UPI000B31A0D9|nr:hypothetical protein [Roseofilum reptotaenium]MDB9515675.1 hypothetical protein [Roseofilum reptotaenium CS-1145]